MQLNNVTVNTGVIFKAPYLFKIHLTNVFLTCVCLQSVSVLPEMRGVYPHFSCYLHLSESVC